MSTCSLSSTSAFLSAAQQQRSQGLSRAAGGPEGRDERPGKSPWRCRSVLRSLVVMAIASAAAPAPVPPVRLTPSAPSLARRFGGDLSVTNAEREGRTVAVRHGGIEQCSRRAGATLTARRCRSTRSGRCLGGRTQRSRSRARPRAARRRSDDDAGPQCYRQRQSLAAAAVGEAVAGGRGAAGRALWGAWSKFREAAERELTQAHHEHPPARRRVHGFARAGGAAVRSSREASGVPQPLLSVPDWRRTDARTRHGC